MRTDFFCFFFLGLSVLAEPDTASVDLLPEGGFAVDGLTLRCLGLVVIGCGEDGSADDVWESWSSG